jgi:hypothetical protein
MSTKSMTRVGDIKGRVRGDEPVTLSSSIFLSLLWVGIETGILAEKLRQIVAVGLLLKGCITIDTVGELVRASHYGLVEY